MTVHELIENLQDLRMPDADVEVSVAVDEKTGEVTYGPLKGVSYDDTRGPVYIDGQVALNEGGKH